MYQTDHAQAMTDRFRELVEQSGDSLPDNHYDELKLIIEAGLDTALAETMDAIVGKLNALAHDIQHNADFFD
ncbi:MAG: phosphatase [Pseudomonadota bacterium]